MKYCATVTLGVLAAIFGAGAYAQVNQPDDVTNAPLFLLINGNGQVSPYASGDLLQVGLTYDLLATPDPGYVFSGWQPVNVFNFMEITVNNDGTTNPAVSSTVVSPLPIFLYDSDLQFTQQDITTISDIPGVQTVSEGQGWQADFDPIPEPTSITLLGGGMLALWLHRRKSLSPAL